MSAIRGPVAPAERIGVLDLLRGFAIAGIVLVNVKFFAAPIFSVPQYRLADDFPGFADRLAEWLVMVVAEGKLYPLLALLFGYGFGVQLERHGAGARYVRRLAGLAVLGLAHAFLVWAGDVLVAYAVAGAVLAVFRDRGDRVLLAWAAVLYVAHVAIVVLSGLAYLAFEDEEPAPAVAEVTRAYGEGSFGEVLAQRAADAALTLPSTVVGGGPGFLAMMLLGLWAHRRGVFSRPAQHLRLLRSVAIAGLAAGGASSLAFATLWWVSGGRGWLSVAAFAASAGGFAQTLAYAALLTLLAERGRARLLDPLRPVGRLALTNYLGQSLVAAMIFYGYGLGLYGRVGPAPGLGIALAIAAGCVLFSAAWLRAFRIGPFEWLLRSFTYARPQPLRR